MGGDGGLYNWVYSVFYMGTRAVTPDMLLAPAERLRGRLATPAAGTEREMLRLGEGREVMVAAGGLRGGIELIRNWVAWGNGAYGVGLNELFVLPPPRLDGAIGADHGSLAKERVRGRATCRWWVG